MSCTCQIARRPLTIAAISGTVSDMSISDPLGPQFSPAWKLWLLAALLGGASCTGRGEAEQTTTGLAARDVARVEAPTYVTAPPGDSRLFVVEQVGRVRVIREGRLLPQPFLDITDQVRSGGEEGLLSIAFHPRYRTNGFFYVNYTDRRGDCRIERYRVGDDRDRADRGSAKLILHVDQPYANHKGGLAMFGPDRMLYVGMGDGGSGGDPHGNGQDRSTLLGDLLRIDVDHGDPYSIPTDNPFVGRPGMRGEIWAWGLRNPWRFSFDRTTGLLYIADVGQNRWEEVHVAPASRAGLNYGWNLWEGNHRYQKDGGDPEVVRPALEYSHGEGCSITGGFVYRGRAIPALTGHYLYADHCASWLRSFRYRDGQVTERREWRVRGVTRVRSFGEDAAGELYVCTEDDRVMKLVPGAAERGAPTR
ncbi:MAG TPA: PQQ-dependent sugar dehydrogenase [Candidatus Limnocylindria bacterium]|nr:PQQ-dependent sugar dehydrogenase [Candidatus Limnocylindria bacterium]